MKNSYIKNPILRINYVDMPSPSSITWSLQDISSENSGRSVETRDQGLMHKDIIARKRKLSITWPAMPKEKAATILKAVSASATFLVTYPDLLDDQDETRTFYVGDRTAGVLFWWEGRKWVKDLQFDLIEV